MESLTDMSACQTALSDCNVSNPILQEINDLMEMMKPERQLFMQHSLILETIKECISDDCNISSELRTKVQSIILGNVEQCTGVSSKSSSPNYITLLGLVNLSKTNLTHDEKKILKQIMEHQIISKSESITGSVIKQDSVTSASSNNTNCLNMDVQDKILLENKAKLNHQQNLCITNQLAQSEVLLEFVNLRLQKTPEVSVHKLEECEVKTKLNDVKSNLMETKNRRNMFTETDYSLKAYKELIDDIKKQKELYTEDINFLQELKEKYKQVSCKEYDEILKYYGQYKTAIEKYKKLNKKLGS